MRWGNAMADAGVCLVESYPVTDTYADGLGRIEKTGQNLRLVLFVNRQHDDGTIDREIVQRIVVPIEAVIPGVLMLLAVPSVNMELTRAIFKFLAGQRPELLQ
jgi:hypothetical protein